MHPHQLQYMYAGMTKHQLGEIGDYFPNLEQISLGGKQLTNHTDARLSCQAQLIVRKLLSVPSLRVCA